MRDAYFRSGTIASAKELRNMAIGVVQVLEGTATSLALCFDASPAPFEDCEPEQINRSFGQTVL